MSLGSKSVPSLCSERSEAVSLGSSPSLEKCEVDDIASPKQKRRTYEQGRCMRSTLLGGLLSVWFCIIAAVVVSLGFVIRVGVSPRFNGLQPLTSGSASLITLAAVTVTFLIQECLGFIHTITLRWALWKEGRLHWNTNLRLLTSTRKSVFNHWTINIVYFGTVIISYSAAGHIYMVYTTYSYHRTGLSLLPPLVLACSLFVQAFIVLCAWWCMRRHILTWTSNPLNTSLACLQNGELAIADRCMHSYKKQDVEELESDLPVYPTLRQASLFRARLPARWTLSCLWAVFIISTLWASIFQLCTISYAHPGQGGVGGNASILDYGRYTQIWPDHVGPTNYDRGYRLEVLLILALVFGCQIYLNLGLHCAEILVNTTRDESAWRKADSVAASGTSIDSNAIKAALSSWEAMTLFAFKIVVHWMFGRVIRWDEELNKIVFWVNPVWILAGLTFLLAIFGTFLALRSVNGPQPAAFGHCQTLINLIDDWGSDGEPLFWGDKGAKGLEDRVEVRHAGTASKRELLGPIQMDALYR